MGESMRAGRRRCLRATLNLGFVLVSLLLIGCPSGPDFEPPPLTPETLEAEQGTGQVNIGGLSLGGANITQEGAGIAGGTGSAVTSNEDELIAKWVGAYGPYDEAQSGGEKGDPQPDYDP